jgi:hypothetical protein
MPDDHAATFDEFERQVLRNAFACGYTGRDYATRRQNPKQTRQLIAAAACVIAKRGPRWCVENPKRFQRDTLRRLTWVAQIVLSIVGIFSGGSVWLVLARFLIPAILALLERQYQNAGEFGSVAADWQGIATEAETILRG